MQGMTGANCLLLLAHALGWEGCCAPLFPLFAPLSLHVHGAWLSSETLLLHWVGLRSGCSLELAGEEVKAALSPFFPPFSPLSPVSMGLG